MTYNEAETRFFLIDPILREKGYDDHQCMKNRFFKISQISLFEGYALSVYYAWFCNLG